jgi:hypothetical protein
MWQSPLSRIAGQIDLVTGALVIATRLATVLTIPADADVLRATVLTPAFALGAWMMGTTTTATSTAGEPAATS